MDTMIPANKEQQIILLDELGLQARMLTESITVNLFQLGMVFMKAKELVDHGEWEKWLKDNSGMSERMAQKCMAAYERYGKNAAMQKLEKTKVFRLLSLPDGTETEFLENNDVDNMTSREIEKAVRKVREEMGIEVEKARKSADEESRKVISGLGDENRKKDARIRELEEAVEGMKESVKTATEGQREAAERVQIAEQSARNAIESAKAEADKRISHAEKDARELEALLRESQEECRLAREETMNIKSAQARGDAERRVDGEMTSGELAGAVRNFIMSAGQIPFMGKQFSQMDADEFASYESSVLQMEEWCRGARKAIETCHGGESYVV